MSYRIPQTALVDRLEHHHKVGYRGLRNHLFFICKPLKTKSITIRTLAELQSNAKENARFFEDPINPITNKKEKFVKK